MVAGLAVPPPEGGLTLLRGDPSRREGVPPQPPGPRGPLQCSHWWPGDGVPTRAEVPGSSPARPPGCMRPRLSLPRSLRGPPRWSSPLVLPPRLSPPGSGPALLSRALAAECQANPFAGLAPSSRVSSGGGLRWAGGSGGVMAPGDPAALSGLQGVGESVHFQWEGGRGHLCSGCRGLGPCLLGASVYPSCVITRVLDSMGPGSHAQGPGVGGDTEQARLGPDAPSPGPQAPPRLPAHARRITGEEGLGLQAQATFYQPGRAELGPGAQGQGTEESAAPGEQ